MYDIERQLDSPSSQNSSFKRSSILSSRRTSTISDFDCPDITNVEDDFGDVHSTTAVLHHCTRTILKPYHCFLTFLGWRPISTLYEESFSLKIVNMAYLLFVVTFTILGFVLQGVLCYRRDGMDAVHQNKKHLPTAANDWNFSLPLSKDDQSCEIGFCVYYIFPNILPLVAFLYTLHLFRFSEYEQLHILMEKAFLQTHQPTNLSSTQPKLCKIVWIFLTVCIFWVLISCVTQGLHTKSYLIRDIEICRLGNKKVCRNTLLSLMLVTTFFHDIIFITVLWSYGIQCQLLIFLMKDLCERIRNRMSLQDAIKEIEECNKFIRYLNDEMSVSVAILVLYSAILTTLGFINLMKIGGDNPYKFSSVILSIVTWMTAFAFPIIQAARLAGVYNSIKDIGHYVRCRPFGYQNNRRDELDSFLLYTSTLKTKIKLFRVPVNVGVITFGLAICIFIVFVLGELNEMTFSFGFS